MYYKQAGSTTSSAQYGRNSLRFARVERKNKTALETHKDTTIDRGELETQTTEDYEITSREGEGRGNSKRRRGSPLCGRVKGKKPTKLSKKSYFMPRKCAGKRDRTPRTR